jgi:hypothetical protein
MISVESPGVIPIDCQYPLTATYAFMDYSLYRAQGQTLSNVLVDIARPPHATLSLFNVYVALS